ncbi:MAG: hypothetical protein PVG89_11060 [Gammaproteobacteria bacterium]|jgi:hypothetical protein
MKIAYCQAGCLIASLVFPPVGDTATITGQWCENGKPYTCYPPVSNSSNTYVCTDSTSITDVKPDSLQWIIKETVHYYTDGVINGKTETRQRKTRFIRRGDADSRVFEHREDVQDASRSRKLTIDDDKLDVVFNQLPSKPGAVKVHRQTTYRRCDETLNKETYYTALVDCGGSGDYIAAVPEVIEDPLLWNPGRDLQYDDTCRVLAKCWGGGWAAYAISDDTGEGSQAFGAACGESSRHDAKAQAINTCRASGGRTCLFNVVSGYDDGSTNDNLSSQKGINTEYCNYGICKNTTDGSTVNRDK